MILPLPIDAIYFADGNSATRCAEKIRSISSEILSLQRRYQDLSRERDEKTREFRESKQSETQPLNQQISDLTKEEEQLAPVLAETSKRATEERVLGAPFSPVSTAEGDSKPGSNDWAQIISSNLARLSSLGIMFFLVAVLVPQYRYNIRMAAFYDARADNLRLAGILQPITHLQDLEKAIAAMTPNIDFGKAPATPIDQLVELIKAARH
jgi:hypothetical protein